jgi:hypothetical protein
MRISPIVNVWLNNGASGQPSGEKPLPPGVAGQMCISSSVNAGLWLNAAFGRLLPNWVRKPRFLPLSALTTCATRLRRHSLTQQPTGWITLRCLFRPFEPLLGHANIATTTIYTRVSADDLARMMGTGFRALSENCAALISFAETPVLSLTQGQKGAGKVSGFLHGLGEMLGLNDKDEMFLSWFDPRVSVLPEIPFRQGIEEVQMGIFLDANQLPAYLKGAVRVVRVNNGERDTRITFQIAELLASLGETETDVLPIPVEPDRSVVWLTFRPDGGDMCQGSCVQQISALLWNIEHQRVFPSVRTGEDLSSISSTGRLSSNLLTAAKKYLASLCIR